MNVKTWINRWRWENEGQYTIVGSVLDNTSLLVLYHLKRIWFNKKKETFGIWGGEREKIQKRIKNKEKKKKKNSLRIPLSLVKLFWFWRGRYVSKERPSSLHVTPPWAPHFSLIFPTLSFSPSPFLFPSPTLFFPTKTTARTTSLSLSLCVQSGFYFYFFGWAFGFVWNLKNKEGGRRRRRRIWKCFGEEKESCFLFYFGCCKQR